MSEANEQSRGTLEKMITALFGETVDAKAEAKRLREKAKKRTEDTVRAAEEILAENHKQVKDISYAVCVDVAGKELVKELEAYERDVNMLEKYPGLKKAAGLSIDHARTLLHAADAYERVCRSLDEPESLSEEEKNRLEKARKEAVEICCRNGEEFSMLTIRTYAFAVLYHAAAEFAAKEHHTLQDAEEVLAARAMSRLIIDLYNGYDVLAAEERIHDIERYNHYKDMPGIPEKILLATIPAEGREHLELFKKAAEEIDTVLNHTEDLGYSLNYIRSGLTRYSVFRWKGEKADPESDEPVYNMWAEDIGEYDTHEEAAEAAGEDGGNPAEVQSYDPEEMWTIVDADGHNPTGMIYPTKLRAAIFLIGLLGEKKLPNWTAWEKLLDSKKEKKDA